MAELGSRFDDAPTFATKAHREQRRKGPKQIPYMGHLLGVCSLVIEDGGDEDEAIAALLHDAVEDQGGEPMFAEIRARFGDRVADIVLACSDSTEEEKEPWRERKESYLAALPAKSPGALRVSLADKLFNARSILRDFLDVGPDVWSRFNAGRDGQLWYYRQLADRFGDLLPRDRMALEFDEVVSELQRLAGSQ